MGDGYARTLTSCYRTGGSWRTMGELVPRDMREEWLDPSTDFPIGPWRPAPPRFFTQRECCRLQGFPETFLLVAPNRRCKDPERFYHFIGNAVAPPVIQAIGSCLLRVLFSTVRQDSANECKG